MIPYPVAIDHLQYLREPPAPARGAGCLSPHGREAGEGDHLRCGARGRRLVLPGRGLGEQGPPDSAGPRRGRLSGCLGIHGRPTGLGESDIEWELRSGSLRAITKMIALARSEPGIPVTLDELEVLAPLLALEMRAALRRTRRRL